MKRFQRSGNGGAAPAAKQENKSKTVKRFYAKCKGGTLSCTVWERVSQGQNGEFATYTVTLQQSYQSGDKREWTNFIAEDAIAAASVLLTQAFCFLANQDEEGMGEEPQQ